MCKYDKSNAIKINDYYRFTGELKLYLFEDDVLYMIDSINKIKCWSKIDSQDLQIDDAMSISKIINSSILRSNYGSVWERNKSEFYYYDGQFFNCSSIKEFQSMLKLKAFW